MMVGSGGGNGSYGGKGWEVGSGSRVGNGAIGEMNAGEGVLIVLLEKVSFVFFGVGCPCA